MTTFRDPSGQPAPAPMPSAERIRAGLLGASSSNGTPAILTGFPAPTRSGDNAPGTAALRDAFAEPVRVVPHVPPIRPEMEASLREVAQVDRPAGPGGRMPWLKRFILLLARPFAGRQAVFNERIQAALYEVSQRSLLTDQQLEHLVLARTQHLARQHAEAQQSIDHLQQQIQAMNHNFEAQLQAALHEQTTRLLQAISENATATIEETRENRQAFETLSREVEQRITAASLSTARQNHDAMQQRLGEVEQRITAASLSTARQNHDAMQQRLGEVEQRLDQGLTRLTQHADTLAQQAAERLETSLARIREQLELAVSKFGSAQSDHFEAMRTELENLVNLQQSTLEGFHAQLDQNADLAERLDKSITNHSGLVRQQVSDQIHAQFGHLREQQESLAQSAASTLSETASSLRAFLDQHADIAERLGQLLIENIEPMHRAQEKSCAEMSGTLESSLKSMRTILDQHADLAERLGKAISDHAGLVRQQVSDQIHTQFGHLREVFNGLEASVVAATSAKLADVHGNSVSRAVDILDRAAQRSGEQATARMLQAIQQQQAVLDRQLAAILTEESAALRGIVARVEEALARHGAPGAEGHPPADAPAGPTPAKALRGTAEDLEYFQFELRMRGNPADIRQRQEKQIGRLRELLGGSLDGRRVLDVGAGTGIFVQLLSEAGVRAEGIDLNRVSVDAGRALGRPVRCANALDDLRERPEASLHAITAFQVAEHLPEAVLREFVGLAFRALLPGGVILFETLNPRSLVAFRWYFMDLSHQHFLQPEALSHLVETAGFRDITIQEYSTPPAWERLNDEAPADDATRQNFRLLNNVLFGPMEYCLVGRKPE